MNYQFQKIQLDGEVKYTNIKTTDNTSSLATYLISLGTFLVTTVVIWLLCLWLTPTFLEKSSDLASKKILPIIGFGILGLIAMPILSIILLMIGITTTVALLLLTLYFILLTLSSSIFAIGVANCVAKKFKVTKAMGILGILILSSAILWLLKLIPIVGRIFSVVYVVLGLGIILTSILFKNSKTNIETKEEKNA